MFTTRHEKGALLKCLDVLARHDLNMTKLESRPLPNRPWEYFFYLDFEGNAAAPKVVQALDELKGQALFLKVLGSYPAKAIAEKDAIAKAQLSAPSIEQASLEATAQPASQAVPVVAKSKHYKLVSRAHRTEGAS